MNERRRNIFVLLLVLGLIAGSVAVLATKETKLGLDLQGGVQLVYEGKSAKPGQPLDQEGLSRAVDIIRDRVDALGVAEPEVALTGGNQIDVSLPAVEDPDRAAEQVGSTAQMVFYDWEPNILDEDCRTNENEVNGGQTPIPGFRNAVERASKCPADADDNNTNASQKRFYGFTKAGKPLNGGVAELEREKLFEDRPEENGAKVADGEKEGDQVFEVPEGVLIVRQEKSDPDAPDPDAWWVIKDDPALQGTEIKNPEQQFDQRTNEPIVTMEFTDRGKRNFQETTRAIAQRGADNALPNQSPLDASHHFAIVLDNELVSTPYINYAENPDGIDGETGAQISGGFTIQSAQDLSKFLKIGALPVELELISRTQVSATLGKQALEQGLVAGIAGFGIVALFLLTFYRLMGVIAVGALIVYSVYFYALIKLIPVTMTLPGIAGLILTLGVAADANIVIFERVKEEIRRGRSVSAGIAEGYKKGFSTIIDANVVTLLVAFILFILATAGVKGFALMLFIGTIVSLLTAVLATQAILLSLRGTRVLQSRETIGAGEQKRRWTADFMGLSRYFFSASGLILLVGALAIAGNGLNFGIDFESGTRIKAAVAEPLTVERVRDSVDEFVGGNAKIQTVQDPEFGKNVVQISTETLRPEQVTATTDKLGKDFGGVQDSQVESIGPTFGESVANAAWVAVVASLLVISIYIALRFEWKYAVPVLVALMHDILITAGVYALVDREVTTSTVAALLTILGFSLYDTIIVFDRIRENVPRMPNAAFSQIVNRSMSEVLTRSLATSFCTILPVLGLLVFGGETLKDFAFALIIGTASGTYSSVFIAGPMLTHWKEREPIYKARRNRIAAEFGTVPAYASQMQGKIGPVDVEPELRRREVRLSADPSQGVSREEFDDLVANLGVETKPAVAPPRTGRPAGGRRARSQGAAGTTPEPPPASGPPSPEDEAAKRSAAESAARKQRKKHGRPN